MLKNQIIKATAMDGTIRLIISKTTQLVEEARERHEMSPVGTVALGRLLTGGAMMGAMLKDEAESITLKIKGDGELNGLVVTANPKAEVRGYVYNPQAQTYITEKGKIDVGKSIGNGTLSVTKDLGFGEPITGQTALVSGEIGEDLTAYFAISEQTPSAVAVGVHINSDNHVDHAGGFLLQLMPDVEEENIVILEHILSTVDPITTMMAHGLQPEDILHQVFGVLNPQILETIEPQFVCHCSRDKMQDMLTSLDANEVNEWKKEGIPVEVVCDYCNSHYVFEVGEL